MTKHNFTALDFYILTETLLNSLSQGGYWTGSSTKEAREAVLKKLQVIMKDMNVEVLTDTPDATTISADTGI